MILHAFGARTWILDPRLGFWTPDLDFGAQTWILDPRLGYWSPDFKFSNFAFIFSLLVMFFNIPNFCLIIPDFGKFSQFPYFVVLELYGRTPFQIYIGPGLDLYGPRPVWTRVWAWAWTWT